MALACCIKKAHLHMRLSSAFACGLQRKSKAILKYKIPKTQEKITSPFWLPPWLEKSVVFSLEGDRGAEEGAAGPRGELREELSFLEADLTHRPAGGAAGEPVLWLLPE